MPSMGFTESSVLPRCAIRRVARSAAQLLVAQQLSSRLQGRAAVRGPYCDPLELAVGGQREVPGRS